jgi:diguanylate cyclase (GGDEF)-like protein
MYPEDYATEDQIYTYYNQPFKEFLGQENYAAILSQHDIDRLQELYETLEKTARSYIEAWKVGGLPLTNFSELVRLSDEFTLRLRRLELELALEENGVDPLTGLRNAKVMYNDLERELSACARRQDYIGIALGRIDEFAELKESLNEDQLNKVIQEVAKVLKQTMRIYDDGYRFGEGSFVFCFKHTDRLGSVSAVERFVKRLRDIQNNEDKPQIFHQLPEPVTLSYSIAKLEIGSDIKALVQGLNNDVCQYPVEKELILEYQEFTPVQQYMKEMQD